MSAIGYKRTRNYPNADLRISKDGRTLGIDGRTLGIQVKATGDFGWIGGGGVNETVCAGGPIFNRVPSADGAADAVVFLSIDTPHRYRAFVVPVEDAERVFRRNVNAYFNTPKRNGEPKSKRAAAPCSSGMGV